MRPIISILLLNVLVNYSYAQDTTYVFYENIEPNHIFKTSKHKDDPNPIKVYPFDGGALYYFPKKAGAFTNDLIFSYISYTPDWMDHQFYYKKVDTSILERKDFKDREWFDNTDYDEIINHFSGDDKVIMLLDKTQVKNDSAYLVRVYFSYPAIE